MTDGFTLTVTGAPTGSFHKYLVAWPKRSRPRGSTQPTTTTIRATEVGVTAWQEGDRILTSLHGGDNTDEIMESWAGRFEFLQDIGISNCVDFCTTLELLEAFWTGQSQKILLIVLISGKASKQS